MMYNDNVFNIFDKMKDKSISFIFSDPPYNMGSKYRINPETGKPQEVILSEFMGNKWEGLTCEQIEVFFKECFRICKYGAYVVLYGIDRVQMPFEYYAQLAGFEPQQYLYSFKISNFPKSSNASKLIDKREGAEREVVYRNPYLDGASRKRHKINDNQHSYSEFNGELKDGLLPDSIPSSDLAKKYDGYHYSISPMKQVLETVMIFKKPYPKGMSTLDSIYAYEEGDKEVQPSIVNIEGGRVVYISEKDCDKRLTNGKEYESSKIERITSFGQIKSSKFCGSPEGRYPSQLFIVDDERLKEEIGYNTSDIIDNQSGNLISGSNCIRTKPSDGYHGNIGNLGDIQITYGDSGGASRILHKCNFTNEEYILQDCLYEQGNFNILTYCTKVSNAERNALASTNRYKLNEDTPDEIKLEIIKILNESM